ncbi:MAG: dolichyl-phosphate beta-glucosyltransferase [Candidatus Dormibacteria bacterium]
MSGAAPMLSVIVPAFNEAARLGPSLERMRTFLESSQRPYEVLVVDDGSQDQTAALVTEAASSWPHLRLISLPRNQGKGAAVKAGMLAASGARRLFTDADLSTPLQELGKLERELDCGAGVAIGSRALPSSRVERHQPLHRELMGKSYNRLLRLLVLPGLHDTQCGFKLFTAEAAELCFSELECLRFGFDAEVLLRARLDGIPIAEVGVTWYNAVGTTVSSFGDGGQMLIDLWSLRRRRSAPRPLAERS